MDILKHTFPPLIRCAHTHIPRIGRYSYRSVWSVAIIFPIYRRNHSPPPSVVFPDYLCSPGMLKRTGASLNGVRRVVSHFARPFPAKTPQPTHPLTHQTPPLYHRPAGGIHRPYKYFCFGVASKVGTSNYATSMGGMVAVSWCWGAMGDKEQNLAHLIESTSGR